MFEIHKKFTIKINFYKQKSSKNFFRGDQKFLALRVRIHKKTLIIAEGGEGTKFFATYTDLLPQPPEKFCIRACTHI